MISKNATLLILVAASISLVVLLLSTSSSSSSSPNTEISPSGSPSSSNQQKNDVTKKQQTKSTSQDDEEPVNRFTTKSPKTQMMNLEASSQTSASKSKSTLLHFPTFPPSYFNSESFPSLQSASEFWTSLLDVKGKLEWMQQNKTTSTTIKKRKMLNFQHLLPSTNDKLLIDEIFSKITIEAHGDSTLRELVKFLINRLKVKASLEKKDANMTYRAPKFFLSRDEKENLMRVAFRFDFFGESLLEEYKTTKKAETRKNRDSNAAAADEVPIFVGKDSNNDNDKAQQGEKKLSFSFFEQSEANIALISIGVHVAKTLIMEKGIKDQQKLMKIGIYDSIIYPLQDFILLRCLHIRVERDAKTGEVLKLTRLLLPVVGQEQEQDSLFTASIMKSSPPVDLIMFFAQSLECPAMQASSLTGFKMMSKHCQAIQNFLDRLHEKIKSDITDVLRLSSTASVVETSNKEKDDDENVMNTEKREERKRNKNSLLHESLTKEERMILKGRFLYVGPLPCNGRDPAIKSSLTGSKPFCSKDGLHLRSKYLRLKLDLLFNLIVNWWKMARGS